MIVVYDACVLYPALLRDILIEIAVADLVQSKWTDQIHQEWIGNLVRNRPEIENSIRRTKSLMDEAIPDALVINYEPLIESITLPDPKDRHVLAAAVMCGAQYIVTTNLTDFPPNYLSTFDVEALHPDEFIEHLFSLNQGVVISCFKRIRARLQNPRVDAVEYLDNLATSSLPVTARLYRVNLEIVVAHPKIAIDRPGPLYQLLIFRK